ncbi:MAG: PAS domain-containing protein [Alphaproteobacteria bacterium]
MEVRNMSRHVGIESLGLPADCNATIREAVAYWLSIKPGQALPGRQHLDPVDIPHLLPNVWLIDVKRNPLRFVFRLVGTGVVEFFGNDPTGRRLDEVFDEFEQTVAYKDFCSVAEDKEPRWRRGTPVLFHLEKFSRIERVYLPLARNGYDVDMIFCLSVFGVHGAEKSMSFAPLD